MTGRGEITDRTPFPAYRASFLNLGCDPRAVDTMSLYEILSMILELEKQNKGTTAHRPVSDEEWEQASQLIASVTLNDPSVRIH